MKLLNRYFEKYALIIFGVITLIYALFLKQPFCDETHAYDIACLSFGEIFQITRIEGHTFLWYYILKPFCALNLFPYSMIFVNWAFCMGALYVLWKKAPFSTFAKTCITFSTPFLLYYAIFARCYCIGLFFFFLLCSIYPKRFKRPYLFSSILCICANCNTMMLVGCFYLGLTYVYELILRYRKKLFSKKKLLIVFLIFFLCSILILSQFLSLQTSDKGDSSYFFNLLFLYLAPIANQPFALVFRILCAIAFYYLLFYLFKNCKKALFFILPTYLTITYIFATYYSGHFWNYYTYLIYFIALFWLFKKYFKKDKLLKFLFPSILFMLIIPYSIFEDGKIELVFKSEAKQISQIILNNPELKNSKLYQIEWWSDIHPGASRYLIKENIKIYDMHNRNRLSFPSMRDIFVAQKELIDFDEFYENMDKNGIIITGDDMINRPFKNMQLVKSQNDYIFKTQKAKYLIKEIVNGNGIKFFAYKVYKI